MQPEFTRFFLNNFHSRRLTNKNLKTNNIGIKGNSCLARSLFEVLDQAGEQKRIVICTIKWETIKLKTSDTMQVTGIIFNSDYFVLDTKTNFVFRKEIFREDCFS